MDGKQKESPSEHGGKGMDKSMKNTDFEALVGRIQTTSDALQQDALVVINRSVTARAWITGYYIVEYEQHGKDRAKYGERLLNTLSKSLGGDAFSVPSLKTYRLFYKLYPSLSEPIAAYLTQRFGKGQSPIVQLPLQISSIGQSPIDQLGNQEMIVSIGDSVMVSPWHLFNRLSYTHITKLLNLPDDVQRTFYAFEAIRGSWSVRELRRQIESQYYQRCGWSKDPHALSRLTLGKAEKLSVKDFIKADTVLEFLNLQKKDVWDENDLENGILDHLQEFILEMGAGFCFEARQKKILIDDSYEKIDLVFYHRILKCHVLIELKTKKFSYVDAAQLGVYMAYYSQHVCELDDNPPVGILLCTEVGQEMAEYVNTFVAPELFISKYQLQLPPKEKMVEFLKHENARGSEN